MNDSLTVDQVGQVKEDLLSGREVCLTVRGGSMWPFVRDGDVLIIQPAVMDDLSVGDIVLTSCASGVICHRVFELKDGTVRTKGDALVGLDPVVDSEGLLGRAVARKAGGRMRPLTGQMSRTAGWLISRGTVILAPCYPLLGQMKRLIKRFF